MSEIEDVNPNCYVYRMHELSTGRWYIGSRTSKDAHPNDNYISSSSIVQKLIKANPQDWIKQIIRVGTPVEMRELEIMLLNQLDAKDNPKSYNLANWNVYVKRGSPEDLELRKRLEGKPKAKTKDKMRIHYYLKKYGIRYDTVDGIPTKERGPKLTQAERKRLYRYKKKHGLTDVKLEDIKVEKRIAMTAAERARKHREKKKRLKQEQQDNSNQ